MRTGNRPEACGTVRTERFVEMNRKDFLLALSGAALAARDLCADDNLHILPQNDIDRLRLDFNASRMKVRLLFLLSPT